MSHEVGSEIASTEDKRKRWYRYGDSNPGLMAENHPS